VWDELGWDGQGSDKMMDDGWVDGAYGGCGGTGKGGKGDLQSNKNDKYSIVVYTHYSTEVQ